MSRRHAFRRALLKVTGWSFQPVFNPRLAAGTTAVEKSIEMRTRAAFDALKKKKGNKKLKDGIMSTKKTAPCVCAAGLGNRNPDRCACLDNPKDRTAVRAIYDNQGRWRILWRELNGDEWMGTYRLFPV